MARAGRHLLSRIHFPVNVYCTNCISQRIYRLQRCQNFHILRIRWSVSQMHQGVRQHHIWSQSSLGNHHYSTDQRQHDNQGDVDPATLIETDLAQLCDDIKKELGSSNQELWEVARYHFDGKGKAFRPMTILLMAKALNLHNSDHSYLLSCQKQVAMIAEMIHTASLIHDDVIDSSDTRRGKASVQRNWGQRKAIMTGDFILSRASMMLARIRNEDVVCILSQVLDDLVRGEFMQLGSKEDESERFNHYLRKTYKKTASLVANSCKAVAVLAQCTEQAVEVAYEFGRNVGIAFQLVDDLLDFISTEGLMGKPTAADLKLGLATAPVLFAAHQYPELNPMIMRRFSQPGDVDQAFELVGKSEGVSHTRYLAEQHAKQAIQQVKQLRPSRERDALLTVTHKVINRLK